MSTENKYRIVFFALFIVSCLFFFDVIRVDMEDKSQLMPAYISGEAEQIPTIEERLGTVEFAACSSSEMGQKIVRTAAISAMKIQTDDMGGNGIVDIKTGYGKHKDLHDKCPFGVYVTGTAVAFANN